MAALGFHERRHAECQAAITSLSHHDGELLLALALTLQPSTRSRWAEHAAKLGLHGPGNRAWTTHEIEPVAERLAAASLVIVERSPSGAQHLVPPWIAILVLSFAVERGKLDGPVLARAPVHDYDLRRIREHAGVQLRIAVARRDRAAVARAIGSGYAYDRDELRVWLLAALGSSPPVGLLELLPEEEVRASYLAGVVDVQAARLHPPQDHVVQHAIQLGDKHVLMQIARMLVLVGEHERARALPQLPKHGAAGLALLAAFWAGDYEGARAIGDAALVAMRTRKLPALPGLEGVCHLLATIVACSQHPEQVESVGTQLRAAVQGRSVDEHALAGVHARLLGQPDASRWITQAESLEGAWPRALLSLLHDVWLRPSRGGPRSATPRESADIARAVAEGWRARAEASGAAGVARELAAIVAAFDGAKPAGGLAAAFQPRAAWEIALASLESVTTRAVVSPASAASAAARELIWEVELTDDELAIAPRVRTASARAKKGQVVSLSRLLSGSADDVLTEADRRVLATAAVDVQRSWAPIMTLGLPALLAMVGHPRVFGPGGAPLTIERGHGRIHVRRDGEQTRVELIPPGLLEHALLAERVGADRVRVYERGPELERIASILARVPGLAIPPAGRERLARVLGQLAADGGIELVGEHELGTVDVAAQPRPLLQLGWDGACLVVRVRVAPLGLDGPIVQPGQGSAVLLGQSRGSSDATVRRCTRDLEGERLRVDALLDACPRLASFAHDELYFAVPSLDEALDVVLELDALGDTVLLSWREGQKLAVPTPLALGELRVKVTGAKAWLDVDVAVAVDEHTVLRYRELLRDGHAPRFIALPHGRFAALSEDLRRHLDGLGDLGRGHRDSLRVAPASLPLLDELASAAGDARYDAEVRARLEQLRTIAQLEPRIPRGFATTLRDYQRDGFVWMARLAALGLGACLADDMGLGKTVQALALLAHRAKGGPALVVCPTSVVRNWITEGARFAPSLRVVALNDVDDRAAALVAAGPRDVIVCSYALLTTTLEELAQVTFATAVFDEAHALKNARTQRSMAARRIDAGFRLALTGTPIENHVGELWSLFDVVVPGLLGSATQFEERFVVPIAKGDRKRSASLRRLLRPFVLRRLKSAVAGELPPRTEITLRVPPNAQQLAFYEAVRSSAVERVAEIHPRKARLQILAEITRLRQAAIDPRVLDPLAGPPGAKLEVLVRRLQQLRAEGHRALVFTQFLGSMALVRERLLAEGIEHLELDGSTPAGERARRIEAFQAGEADVFVLSLRAGGTGVNLTAADYVFHLDPWWNPAVEDQASDRAHRIGQARPVTIYRLVTEGTIEEKILALHESKRELADDLLAGLERGETIDLAGLLALVRG